MDHPLPRHPWGGYFLIAFVTVAVIAFVVLLTAKDNKAIEKCDALGGQTWDQGAHCVLDNTVVINTR